METSIINISCSQEGRKKKKYEHVKETWKILKKKPN